MARTTQRPLNSFYTSIYLFRIRMANTNSLDQQAGRIEDHYLLKKYYATKRPCDQ